MKKVLKLKILILVCLMFIQTISNGCFSSPSVGKDNSNHIVSTPNVANNTSKLGHTPNEVGNQKVNLDEDTKSGAIQEESVKKKMSEKEKQQKAILQLEIQDEGTEDGDKPALKVTIYNADENPLWVNKRFLFNNGNAPKSFKELWFKVISPNGKELDFGCKIRAGFPEASDYIVLKPKEMVSKLIKISMCFDFSEQGKYKVQGFYQDGNEEPPDAPTGAIHLENMITSKAIEVTKE